LSFFYDPKPPAKPLSQFGRLASTHLERLKATNTNDRYLSLIAATRPLYSAFMYSIAAGIGTSADRKSKTVSTDEAVKAIKNYISRKEGVLADRFPRKSADRPCTRRA
jgi:hypothetical protein